MVQRVTIYGWIIDPHRFQGSAYALVDLVYFVDDYVTVSDILDVIKRQAGYRIIPKRIDNRSDSPPEQDKVTIEEWNSHITVGTERVPQIEEARQQSTEYTSRYNLPAGGMRF